MMDSQPNSKSEPQSNRSRSRSRKFESWEAFKQQLKSKPGIYIIDTQVLDSVLDKLSAAIKAEEESRGDTRFNIWIKQRFSVGINDVTRSLERMPSDSNKAILRNERVNNESEVVGKSLFQFSSGFEIHPDDSSTKQSFETSKIISRQRNRLQDEMSRITRTIRDILSELEMKQKSDAYVDFGDTKLEW
eukprot:TRINITY_DN2712_c0_g1_i2.p1 TRINITY_DN2712_c0_g1~~TRINITY_DN2712_c0_g1_i2.p1  ORF type:complete len:189 (+),score=33.15 TRINITY_DN2712_c0_g1_i2:141-707(+)